MVDHKNNCCVEVASNCLHLWGTDLAHWTIRIIKNRVHNLGGQRSGLGNPGGALLFATYTIICCLRGGSEYLIQVSSSKISPDLEAINSSVVTIANL